MRKTVCIFIVFFTIGIGDFATAQYIGPGNSAITTVKTILDNPVDEMHVALRGKISKKISHDTFIFTDTTGQIQLEISKKRFPPGKPITPDMVIEINGEVDAKHMGFLEIEVKTITLNPNG